MINFKEEGMKDTELCEGVLREAASKIIPLDDLMLTLSNNIDNFIDETMKIIVTKGGLLNESNIGNILPSKVEKYREESERIFNRIDSFINPSLDQQGQPVRPRSVPNMEQTNELIYFINDQIPTVLKWMTKVFAEKRNNVLFYDNDDRINMYNACLAYKNSIDNLREIIKVIGGDYDLPIDFELPYRI